MSNKTKLAGMAIDVGAEIIKHVVSKKLNQKEPKRPKKKNTKKRRTG